MIHVLDLGLGNPASVKNMLARLGAESRLCSDPTEIAAAQKIILPGVGAFDAGIAALRSRGVDQAIRRAVDGGARLLGICLGMQLLFEGSEEGELPGLALVQGRVRRFRFPEARLRVPHMGWNRVEPASGASLFEGGPGESRFYFVHSYFAECTDPRDVAGTTIYGHPFTCAVERGRVLGVQFHPEKSHRFGMQLLKRFSELSC